ncbi:hypothetical protein GCM10011586_21920 [Silvibacterium dinghuense]|nr:hypothetical protein GCM10011586_21920 [Silvibacterium dinghuense]
MLLLGTMKNIPTENDALRRYQRDRWGMKDGETCVIELSGLPAKGFHIKQNRAQFREERIKTIRERMLSNQPSLCVMYGWGNKPHYEQIVGDAARIEQIDGFPAAFAEVGRTTVVITTHPTAKGVTNRYWQELGVRLRPKRR